MVLMADVERLTDRAESLLGAVDELARRLMVAERESRRPAACVAEPRPSYSAGRKLKRA